jgi:hypothetical protein
MPREWIRVSKSEPCPICAKHDWCMVKADGSAAICARVIDGCARRKDGSAIEAKDGQGWLHELRRGEKGRGIEHGPRRATRNDDRPRIDCIALQQQFLSSCVDFEVQELADSLGVTTGSLYRLGIGYANRIDAFTFPMRDGANRIVGFRTRHADGRKRAVPGSRSGLFIPTRLSGSGPLLICEGPTDTAAALAVGFDAIGRPSCRGGTDHILALLKRQRREVWIVSDRDTPGRQGAEALAEAVFPVAEAVKVIAPPSAKDLRAWVVAGATRTVIEAVASQRRNWIPRKAA